MANINAICPKCGGILLGEETPTTEWTRGKYTDFVVGHCFRCERKYLWHEVYRLTAIENLTEVEEDE